MVSTLDEIHTYLKITMFMLQLPIVEGCFFITILMIFSLF